MKYLTILALALLSISCGDKIEEPDPEPMVDGEIWSGAETTFTKLDGEDPLLQANQDRITDNVWISRGNDGGQIFNAASEQESTKETSPAGTSWAVGKVEDIETLSFAPFRTAVGQPKDAVGVDLIMFLESDKIYIPVTFLSWGQSMNGGFSYTRATRN